MAPLILVEHCVLKIIGFKVGFYFGDSISWWKEAKLSTRGAAFEWEAPVFQWARVFKRRSVEEKVISFFVHFPATVDTQSLETIQQQPRCRMWTLLNGCHLPRWCMRPDWCLCHTLAERLLSDRIALLNVFFSRRVIECWLKLLLGTNPWLPIGWSLYYRRLSR